MKTFKSRKNLYTFIISALLISFFSFQSLAQEEKKEVKIKIVKEENGKTTVIDTTINIADLENNDGLKQLLKSEAFGGMDINIDDLEGFVDMDIDLELDGKEGMQKKVIVMKQKDAGSGNNFEEKEYVVTVMKSDSCVDGEAIKVKVDKGGTAYFFSDDGETQEIDMDGNVHKVIVKSSVDGEGETIFFSDGYVVDWTGDSGRKVEVIESENGQKVIVHNEDGTTQKYDLTEGKGSYMIDEVGNIQKVDGDVSWTSDEGEMTMVTVDVEDDGETIWITTGDEKLDGSGDKHHNVFIHSSEDIDDDTEVFVEVIAKNDGGNTVRIERKIIVKKLDTEDIKSLEKSGVKISSKESDNLEIGSMKFHPNPTNGKFTLSFEMPEKGETEVLIYDINGKNVYSEKLSNFEGKYKNEIDISGENKGTYFLKIMQGKKMSTRKIILD